MIYYVYVDEFGIHPTGSSEIIDSGGAYPVEFKNTRALNAWVDSIEKAQIALGLGMVVQKSERKRREKE